MTESRHERIQRIDIDDQACIRSRVCCPGGCAEAPSVFADPGNDTIPVLNVARDAWREDEIKDAVRGCPVSAITVIYETYLLTGEGVKLKEDVNHPETGTR